MDKSMRIPMNLQLFAESGGEPAGGDPGQALAKATAEDFDVTWVSQEASLEPMTDQEIDEICK